MKKLSAFLLAALLGLNAHAQGWPQKPVRFIVPFAAGGTTDIAARILGEKLAQAWGQPVIVENRGGAAGAVGAAEAARAAPDGYTLFFPAGAVLTANHHIYAKLNYDAEKDFVPVTNVATGPQVLAVNAASPYQSVQDLIAAAKAAPGKLNFGHAGIGSQTHLAAENFIAAAQIEVQGIPYKGESPALAGLVGGETAFVVTNVAATVPHVQGGRVRALGVTSLKSVPQLPGVPPIAAALAGFENSGWFGIVAPAGTPREIVDRIYRDTRKALETSEMKARFYAQGLTPVGNSPKEFAAAMKAESAMWARVVRTRRIRVE